MSLWHPDVIVAPAVCYFYQEHRGEEECMATFSTAPVSDVVRPPKIKQPSQRRQNAEQYTAALSDALEHGQALVVEFDPDDKVLTIRNRLQRAARSLGRDDLTIRRRGQRVLAYPAPDEAE
jgi:hypothetical protein